MMLEGLELLAFRPFHLELSNGIVGKNKKNSQNE